MPEFRVLEGFDPLPDDLRGGSVAIGNFDGVHRGHQALIANTRDHAHHEHMPALVLTFEPHPRAVFKPDEPVFRLTPPAEKAHLLATLDVNAMVVIPFDWAFAARTAQEFIDDILIGQLGVRQVVVGYDFHFGRGRAGTLDMLKTAGQENGFGVTVVSPIGSAGAAFSSSAIRAYLRAGEVEAATRALGYRWFVRGPVIDGAKRGRDLGFPTANMQPHPSCQLCHGVYAVRMRRNGETLDGVANYGRRPQFDNGAPLLETYLIDFEGDLYGETVEVEFIDFLRPEAKFESVEALIEQMRADTDRARALLAAANGHGLMRLGPMPG